MLFFDLRITFSVFRVVGSSGLVTRKERMQSCPQAWHFSGVRRYNQRVATNKKESKSKTKQKI